MAHKFIHRKLILKADDFGRGPFLDPWRQFLDVCLEFRAAPSIGIVGSNFQRNASAILLARYFREAYKLEFWNHSATHVDITKLVSEHRINDTLMCQKIIHEHLGMRPTIYGAPFNYIDRSSVQDLSEIGEFDGFYFADDAPPSVMNVPRKFMCTPEIGTQSLHPVRSGYFHNIISRRELPEVIVMQVHPTYWDESSFDEFRKVLKILKSYKYQNLSCEEYFSWERSVAGQPKRLDVGSATYLAESLTNFADQSDFSEHRMSDNDKRYYFGRYKNGLADCTSFLISHGLLNTQRSAPIEVLDVGSGSANWSIAAAAASESVHAVALDRTGWLLEIIKQKILETQLDSRIEFSEGLAEKLEFPKETFDYAMCINAISYMPSQLVMEEIARVTKNGGLLFIGMQNILYPMHDLLDSASALRFESASEFAHRIMSHLGRVYGLKVGARFISYWNDRQFSTLARYTGFQPMLRGINVPHHDSSLGGVPTFWGYMLLRSEASHRRSLELRAGKGASGADLDDLVSCGCVELVAEVLLAAPSLAANMNYLPNFVRELAICRSPLLSKAERFIPKEIIVRNQIDVKAEEDLAIAVASEDWATLRNIIDRGKDWSYGELLCLNWLNMYHGLNFPVASNVNSGPDVHPIISAIYKLGISTIKKDEISLKTDILSFYDAIASKNELLNFLSGINNLPPDLCCPSQPETALAIESNKWLSRL